MKKEFDKAKVVVEKRVHGKQPAIFITENDRVYMITTSPDGDFDITDEGIVGERYDESGRWCGDDWDEYATRTGCIVKPYIYGDFPTIENILIDYYELMDIVKDVKTIEQAKMLEEKGFIIEINGVSIDDYVAGKCDINEGKTNKNIEWIRYERFGCLDCIYVYADGSPTIFDVWCEGYAMAFIDGATIKTVKKIYKKAKEVAES